MSHLVVGASWVVGHPGRGASGPPQSPARHTSRLRTFRAAALSGPPQFPARRTSRAPFAGLRLLGPRASGSPHLPAAALRGPSYFPASALPSAPHLPGRHTSRSAAPPHLLLRHTAWVATPSQALHLLTCRPPARRTAQASKGRAGCDWCIRAQRAGASVSGIRTAQTPEPPDLIFRRAFDLLSSLTPWTP